MFCSEFFLPDNIKPLYYTQTDRTLKGLYPYFIIQVGIRSKPPRSVERWSITVQSEYSKTFEPVDAVPVRLLL